MSTLSYARRREVEFADVLRRHPGMWKCGCRRGLRLQSAVLDANRIAPADRRHGNIKADRYSPGWRWGTGGGKGKEAPSRIGPIGKQFDVTGCMGRKRSPWQRGYTMFLSHSSCGARSASCCRRPLLDLESSHRR